MKKIIVTILLVVACAIFTNANAAVRLTTAKNLNSEARLAPRYIVFESNGSFYLLTIYDNGGTTLTYLGTPLY